jgi:hypothetical protein
MSILNDFLETALWSTIDYDNEENHLDDKYSINNISNEFKTLSEQTCNDFMSKAKHLFTDNELEFSPIGHDIWLTIHHHGAGFWDGDYVNGDELTKIAHKFKELDGLLNESLN